MKIDNTQSLSHTSYRCKYHIVIVVITHETNRDFKARFVCFQNVAYTYILYT